jgi:hypothetical protein
MSIFIWKLRRVFKRKKHVGEQVRHNRYIMKLDYERGYIGVRIYDDITNERVIEHYEIDGETYFSWMDVYNSSEYRTSTYVARLNNAKDKIQSLVDYLNGDKGYSIAKNRYAHEYNIAKSKCEREMRVASREADFIEIKSASVIVTELLFCAGFIVLLLALVSFVF